MQSHEDFKLLNEFAHDLKTPLTSVKTLVDLLENSGGLSSAQVRMCQRAMANIERMERIVHDLLEYARMESNPILNLSSVNMASVIEQTCELMEDAANAREISLVTDVITDAPPIMADSSQMMQLAANLISNAIKYNRPQGKVWISVSPSSTWLQFVVRDNGRGIAQEAQPRIFERFFRDPSGGKGREEGSGLGLAIVKSIVDRHNGHINLQSSPDNGTTFEILLPYEHRVVQSGDSNGVAFASTHSDREMPDAMDDRWQEGPEEQDSDSNPSDY